jgi:hypothetical protein
VSEVVGWETALDLDRYTAILQKWNKQRNTNQTKIGAEIKTVQEEMKAQVGSLTSWIDANQEEMKDEIKFGQAEMAAAVRAISQKMKS